LTVKVNPASVTVPLRRAFVRFCATTIVTVCWPELDIVLAAVVLPILRVNQATLVDPPQASPAVAYTILVVVVAAAKVSNVAVLLRRLTWTCVRVYGVPLKVRFAVLDVVAVFACHARFTVPPVLVAEAGVTVSHAGILLADQKPEGVAVRVMLRLPAVVGAVRYDGSFSETTTAAPACVTVNELDPTVIVPVLLVESLFAKTETVSCCCTPVPVCWVFGLTVSHVGVEDTAVHVSPTDAMTLLAGLKVVAALVGVHAVVSLSPIA
jgi:hypothetical protein